MAVIIATASRGATNAAIALAFLVSLASAASLAIVNGSTDIPTSAMFSTDQSACYNDSNANASIVVRTTRSGRGAVAAAGAPQQRLLGQVGCLQSCMRFWWCIAARWTPSLGACDVASEQFCSDERTPLLERYLRIDAATAFPPPLKLFTLTFSDVRSHEQAYTGCQDALSKGVVVNGIVCIDPDGSGCFPVWCNFTSGEGYATIHRRYGAGVDFTNRSWSEYENGFGDLSGEYWLGLRRIAALTKAMTKLIVDLVGRNNHAFSATYTQFGVASAANKYALSVSGWTTGSTADDYLSKFSGRNFSTRDQDNDLLPTGNCAATRGGWWWDDCDPIVVNINGDYLKDTGTCVFWKGSGDSEGCNLQYIALRIRV